MHTVFGYPFKSTWIKSIKAGRFKVWPMLNERNVAKYYPETTETPKEHMNQTRKNVRSIRQKASPLDKADTMTLEGKKGWDIYTNVYEVRNTFFYNQMGQFPTK